MERTRNSVKNIIFALGGQILNILMSFVMRTVFVKTLGSVYLGVNGLFTNILMVFSLADLGVGTAIIFALYKPIAEGDQRKIQALMNMYGKAYRTIGFVIIGLGLAITPFIGFFVKTTQYIPDLKIIFLLFVFNTASTYFFAYKGTLITANQKNYIVTNVVYISSILCYGVQIAVMLLTHNYILTLSIQVGTNVLQNIILMIIANRMYPYIKKRNNETLRRHEKKKIYRNMGALVFYRTGQVIINGTDNIVISAMVGIVETGIYSNYLLLTTTIKNLLQQVFNAITASVGNLAAIETDDKKYAVFNAIFFGNFWMFGFASVCFWVLFNPFIELWIGKTMLLSTDVVFWIVLNFYMLGMRNVNMTFRDTMGIFREGKYVPMAAALINVGVSVWLAPIYGISGVFIGTAISTVVTLLWLEPIILHKYGFKRSTFSYFVKYFMYFAATAGACYVTQLAANLFVQNTMLTFIGRIAICLVVPNMIFLGLFWKTKDCRTLLQMVFSALRRRLKRGDEA